MDSQYYPINEVEGIGTTYGEKLQTLGITSTRDLLEKGETRAGRKTLAEESGISPKLILTWINQADLMRVSGIGPQYAELLEDAGVDTIKELRTRKAENLTAKMAETNTIRKVAGNVPSVSMVQKWIDSAKEMEPAIQY